MNLDRKIKFFIVSYGRLLLYIIGIIVVFLFILRSINDFYKEGIRKKEPTEEQKIIIEQRKEETTQESKIIEEFVKLCNNGKINEAYNMLSEICKKDKYKTEDQFKKEYIDIIFNINICDYKINRDESKDYYIVTLTEDMLITGKTNSTKQTKIRLENSKIYIYN